MAGTLVNTMSISSIVREYMKKMLAEAGKGMKVLLVDADTVCAAWSSN